MNAEPVMLEIGYVLVKARFRAAAVRLLQAMERDPAMEIVPLSEELDARGMRLHRDNNQILREVAEGNF